MTPVKILFISHSSFINGAENCLFNLVKNINKEYFEPYVVLPSDGPLLEKFEKLNIKSFISPIERWIRYSFDKPLKDTSIESRVQNVINIIKDNPIDLVHSNTSVVLEGAIAAKICNIPHIWHIHEILPHHPELNSCLPLPIVYSIINYLSDKIICVSDFAAAQFKLFSNTNKLHTIYNGVNENNEIKNFQFNEFGNNSDAQNSVTIGLLSEAKGYLNLIEAASIVHKKGYNVKFFWIGAGTDKNIKDFTSRIKKHKLENIIHYLGFRDDIPNILKSSDLLVCSSINEAFPLVILEAMAAGLPVVTTDCGGPSECVVDNKTGFVVPVNDPVALSEKIIQISSSNEIKKSFGKNALKRYNDNFNIGTFTKNFEHIYNEVINKDSIKKYSERDKILIESFLKIYDIISNNNWKENKKNKLIKIMGNKFMNY